MKMKRFTCYIISMTMMIGMASCGKQPTGHVGIWSPTPTHNPKDYDFSFMAVGDTQMASRRSIVDLAQGKIEKGDTYMDRIYDYIVDNVKEKKVKHVIGLGDITDFNAKNEWQEASRVISKLDGKVSYSLTAGNHDWATDWWANKCLKENEVFAEYEPYFLYDFTDGTTASPKGNSQAQIDFATTDEYFSKYFGLNGSYAKQWKYIYEGNPENTIHFFKGNIKISSWCFAGIRVAI